MTLKEVAARYAAKISDEYVSKMFERCFLNTYDTTAQIFDDGSSFVITGDIPAMWLRDSSAQVSHYIPVAKESDEAFRIISGLIKRQADCILIDPYANAYNKEASNACYNEDRTLHNPHVWERKYEVDSLCYPIWLAYRFWKEADTTEHFTDTFKKVLYTIADLWELEQNHDKSEYYFERFNCPPTDTLTNEGKGTPVGYTGMTWSGFRPSDDACEYGYLVPSNMFASVTLGYMSEIATKIYSDTDLAEKALKLQTEINSGIEKYAVVNHPTYGEMYAYETDGLGNHNLMDDANVPSLLSAPYLGYVKAEDEKYQNTRKFILSKENPFYYEGTCAKGIGSPHTPPNYIWHIALSMQGLTSICEDELTELVRLLSTTDGETGFMHEGFHVDDPKKFTRDWFAWSNSIFAEFIIKRINEKGSL